MGIGDEQGSYAVFPTAFPDPSDPQGHTRLNARRYCLLQSNGKVTGGRPGKSLKTQAQPQSYTLTSQLLINYYSHTTND